MRQSINFLKENKRWLYSCLFIFISACNQQGAATTKPSIQPSKQLVTHAKQCIDSISGSIRSGDLVLRLGNDFTSFCFQQFCQIDKSFSHCGIASIEHDTVFIYHALGGEFNPNQKLLKEPLSQFLDPFANKAAGLYRFELADGTSAKLTSELLKAFKKEIRFDMDFDLQTDDRMYCSEFVAKTYGNVFNDTSYFQTSSIGTFRFYSPDNIFTRSGCQKIYQFVY